MSLKDLIRVCSSDIIFLLIHASYDGTCHVNSNLDTFLHFFPLPFCSCSMSLEMVRTSNPDPIYMRYLVVYNFVLSSRLWRPFLLTPVEYRYRQLRIYRQRKLISLL